MASNIDPNVPEEISTTTADTRANFSAAKSEIEAIQVVDANQDAALVGKEPANANIQQHIATSPGNPHNVNKAHVGLSAADNTSDLNKPVSNATQAALDDKKDTFLENTAFNKNFGVGSNDVARGNHTHTAAEVGAAPSSHVGDTSHLTADERAGLTATSSPINVGNPVANVADVTAHSANTALHTTPDQNAALDGAASPGAGNVFATMNDIPAGSGHVIQDPASTPMTQRPNLQFTGDVTVTDDAGGSRTVVDVTAGAGSGEANTGSSLGTGSDVFAQKVAVDLQFRSLLSPGGGLSLTENANDITFDLQYGGDGSAETLSRSDHSHSQYLLTTGKAADSDLLDGNDSLHFATAADLNAHTAGNTHVPSGGLDTQVLVKTSDLDYETGWANTIPEVPSDDTIYGRQNGAWVPTPLSPIGGIFLYYDWSVDTSSTNPGAGYVKCNNADPTLASEFYINTITANANDFSSVIESLQIGDYWGVWEDASDHQGAYYQVTAVAVDNTGWYTLGVSPIPGSAPTFLQDARMVVFGINNEDNKLPAGGTLGQVLTKASGDDLDVVWGTAGATDAAAIHVDVVDEINQIIEKATPASTDVLVVEDSEASWAKKKVLVANITGGGGGSGDVVGPAGAVADNIATYDGTTGKLIADGGSAISDLATAAQGANADTAFGWGNHNTAGYVHKAASSVVGDVALFNNITGDLLASSGTTFDQIFAFNHVDQFGQKLTEKGTLVDNDRVIIEDSADAWAKKWVSVSSLPSGGGGGDLTDAVFPTYAGFDAEVDNTGAAPAVNFNTGNKQIATNVAVGAVTLAAPTVGTYLLRIPDSGSVTSINGSTGTTTWVGPVPTWAAGKDAVIACHFDGINWTLCGSVEE